MQAFLRQALRDGFFHADMHQGNLFVDPAGDIVAIDFGIMGRLGKAERGSSPRSFYGFIRRDYRRVAEVHFQAGYVPGRAHGRRFRPGDPGDRRADLTATGERHLDGAAPHPALRDHRDLRHGDPAGAASPAEDDGRGRGRRPLPRPDFDMWSAAEPVVAEWVERNLGPVGQLELAAEGVGALGRLAGELPRLAERAERLSVEFAGWASAAFVSIPKRYRKLAAPRRAADVGDGSRS